ncbi:MAG: hypothetical protein NZ611_08710 [Bacteroidia bacterium]|nr:hypothetical protein [Bacteroidia bacterium]
MFSSAWQQFQKHWIIGVALSGASLLLSFIPFIGGVLTTLVFPTLYAAYGLKAWASRESLSFDSIFLRDLLVYLKVLVGIVAISIVPSIILGFGTTGEIFTGMWLRGGMDTPLLLILILLAALATIVLAFLLLTYPYFIIDKGMDILSAFQSSIRLSLTNSAIVLGFFAIVIGINLLGALLCGIGLLVTIPFTLIAMAGLYKELAA